LHGFVINKSGLLLDELSGREDGEVRDATHGETCRELLVLIGVDLEDNGLARRVLCCARDLWSGGAARAAPVSPKVYEDGNSRALDNLVEECCINLNRFVEWRQRGFARAATAGVRQVGSCNPIFLAASFARSYHRHLFSPLDWIHSAGFGCVCFRG
jgi:hypothetical protein